MDQIYPPLHFLRLFCACFEIIFTFSPYVVQTANESLLLNNLQKLEESGKVVSPKSGHGPGMTAEVSARDIVSGIISAANRKIQRGQQQQLGVQGRTAKKDSSGSSAADAVDLSGARMARMDTPTRMVQMQQQQQHQQHSDSNTPTGSRRNSESVIQVSKHFCVKNALQVMCNFTPFRAP